MPEVRPLINDGRRIEPAVLVNKITAGWKEVITKNEKKKSGLDFYFSAIFRWVFK